MTFMHPDLLQWLGCATGALGSLLLAMNKSYSRWGFVFFLIANGFWAAYGLETGAKGLVVNQLVFTVTSLIGIYRWFFASYFRIEKERHG